MFLFRACIEAFKLTTLLVLKSSIAPARSIALFGLEQLNMDKTWTNGDQRLKIAAPKPGGPLTAAA